MAGVIALGAVGAASPAQAEPQGRPAASATVTNISQIKVPMKDARGAQGEGVRLGAAVASKGSNVIVFYGDVTTDAKANAALQSTMRAVREVIAEGRIPFKGIIVADASAIPREIGTYEAESAIQIYNDGFPPVMIASPQADVGPRVKEALRSIQTANIPGPFRTAAVSPSQDR